MNRTITHVSVNNLKYPRSLKGDKDISEFTSLREATEYGYMEHDWAWNRLNELGIEIFGKNVKDKDISKKQIGECEYVGMSLYINHNKKKVYMYSHYSREKFYYKELRNYTWN